MSQWIGSDSAAGGNGRHAARGGAHADGPERRGDGSQGDNGEPTVGGTP
jgi:hypothetical protein